MSFCFIQIFYVSLKFLFIWVLQLYKLSPMCFILYCNWIDLSSNAKKKKKFFLFIMTLGEDNLPLIRNIFLLPSHLSLRNQKIKRHR